MEAPDVESVPHSLLQRIRGGFFGILGGGRGAAGEGGGASFDYMFTSSLLLIRNLAP